LSAVTFGSEIAAKSVHLLLLTLVTIGNGRSRRSTSSTVRRQLSDTASLLVEAVVEVNVTVVDWLANFSDYGVTTKLRESYEIVKSPSKIRIRRFHDNLMTS